MPHYAFLSQGHNGEATLLASLELMLEIVIDEQFENTWYSGHISITGAGPSSVPFLSPNSSSQKLVVNGESYDCGCYIEECFFIPRTLSSL